MPITQFPAVFNLSDLNGQNGFKLDGSPTIIGGEFAGISVSYAGDVNEDGYADLIIGAFCPNNAGIPGRSYVVFGGPKVGQAGVLQLASLNSNQGFIINGEQANDRSGDHVSYGGDVNSDGHTDLLISATGNSPFRSYVVYGPIAQGAGIFLLSNLNGTNGFRIESARAPFGNVGDVNRDGYNDLFVSTFVIYGGPNLGQGGSFDIATLNGTNGFNFVEGSFSSGFGGSSYGLGDINGDGNPDLAIGAPYYPYITTSDQPFGPGRSYIVYGSSALPKNSLFYVNTLNGTNGFIIDGEVRGDGSGSALGSIVNFTGTNHLDLLISARYCANKTGCVYVIYGGPQIGRNSTLQLSELTAMEGFKIYGEMLGDMAGAFVDSAGDINNDGYNDLFIGASDSTSRGGYSRNYILFGGQGIGKNGIFSLSELNGTNGFKIDGESMDDYSGASASTIHDFNGDGIDDLIIGAYHYNNRAGRSYVIFGDVPPVLVNNNLRLSPGATVLLNSNFLSAYDRNHANNSLVFIPTNVSHGYFANVKARSVPLANFTQKQIASATIQFVHDGSSFAPSYNITVRSNGTAWAGPEAAQIDFVGAPNPFPAVVSLGSLNGTDGFMVDGETVNDYSGSSVSTAGDINGDGYDDLLIGAYGYPANNRTGRSYVVFGNTAIGSGGILALSRLNGTNGFKLDAEGDVYSTNGDANGYSVSVAGDINGDGLDDLVIGAPFYATDDTGRSYVVFGNTAIGSDGILALSSLNGTNGFKLDGETSYDNSGFSVSTAGDINGDGVSDLLIGAFHHADLTGRSYVVFGSSGVGGSGILALSSLNGANGFMLDGEAVTDYSGYSVSAAGDINGDGVGDLLIGAYGHANTIGRSYVVFGGVGVGSSGMLALSSLNGMNGFKLDGEAFMGYSGKSVSAAGDINGDGVSDLLIGAYCYLYNASIPSCGNGRSYVVFGGIGVGGSGTLSLSSLNGTNGFKLDGEATYDYSGSSVSTAGDINGDGLTDLLIGANVHAGGTGRSYVVFGGFDVGSSGTLALSSLNGTNGFKLDGEAFGSYSGYSVSTAGDVNGDGYSDLMIGAYGHAGGTGRTYVVFGRAPANSNASPTPPTSTSTPASTATPNPTSSPTSSTLSPTSTTASPTPSPTPTTTPTSNPASTPTVSLSPTTTSTSTPVVTVTPTPTSSPANTSAPPTTTMSSTSSGSPTPTLSSTTTNISLPPTTSTALPTITPTLTDSPASSTTNTNIPATSTTTPIISPQATPTPSGTTNSTPAPSSAAASAFNVPLIAGVASGIGGFAIVALLLCYFYPSIRKYLVPTASSKEVKEENQSQGSIELSHLSGRGQGKSDVSNIASAEMDKLPLISSTPTNAELNLNKEKKLESSSLSSSAVHLLQNSQSQDSLSSSQPRSLIVHSLSQPAVDKETPREAKASISRPASPSSPRLMDEAGKVEISFSIAFEDLEFSEKDKLGSGAYGTVYKGTYKFNEVAIKKLHAEHFSQDALVEFKQEASIMATMRSDYIVPLRGVCLESPHFCMVMEWMPKGSLYSLLQNSPELPLPTLYRMALDIGYGLYHLHEAGILHRDLKSMNVLLDDRLRAKLTDFGLSKVKSEMVSTSSSQGMKGTLGWMAPELFDEKPQTSQASDIYAYGMILWELIIRPYHIPFKGLAPASLISAKLTRGEKQEAIPEKCPPKYAELIRWCWQTPQKRPSAQQIAKSLRSLWEAAEKAPSLKGSVNNPGVSAEFLPKGAIQNSSLLTALS
jgi:tRNA A-37 threonylcarbamoyl transferase component Bud32